MSLDIQRVSVDSPKQSGGLVYAKHWLGNGNWEILNISIGGGAWEYAGIKVAFVTTGSDGTVYYDYLGTGYLVGSSYHPFVIDKPRKVIGPGYIQSIAYHQTTTAGAATTFSHTMNIVYRRLLE